MKSSNTKDSKKTEYAIEVKNLSKVFGKLKAVDNVTFNVKKGEIFAFLGPNGAGKTTALRCMSGILRPTAGQVIINGVDIQLDQASAKARLAFVPELPSLYELLTVEEHMRFVAMCFKTLPIFERLKNDLLERYDLAEKRNHLVATLSKGMRQKLSVAFPFLHRASARMPPLMTTSFGERPRPDTSV